MPNRYLTIQNFLLIIIVLFGTSTVEAKPVTLSVQELLKYRQSPDKVIIMSDNKGQASNMPPFKRMNQFIKRTKPQAIIGVGDHLKAKWIQPFLSLIQNDPLWHNRFYPNIADGENGYYGRHQDHYCAGKPLLKLVNLNAHAKTTLNKNQCEYYSIIPIGNFKIHLIQISYADEPGDHQVAFPEASRQWMINIVRQIKKDLNTLIIVAGHSRSGNFLPVLKPEYKNLLMAKADLLLSATTHRFEKLPTDNLGMSLSINTGSPVYQSQRAIAGFSNLIFLKNPNRILLEFISTEDNLSLPPSSKGFVYLKELGKPVQDVHLSNLPRDISFKKPVLNLKQDLSQQQLEKLIIQAISQKVRKPINKFKIKVATGLKAGYIKRPDLEKTIRYNNGVVVYQRKDKTNTDWYARDTFRYPYIANKSELYNTYYLEQLLVDIIIESLLNNQLAEAIN